MNFWDLAERNPKPGFGQEPLPETAPNTSYEYTRRFTIVARGKIRGRTEDELESLELELVPYDDVPGRPFPENKWKDLVKEFLGRRFVPSQNPLDFAIYGRTRVVLKFSQEFFIFSNEYHPITTKRRHGTRYFDLRMHGYDQDRKLISDTVDEWYENKRGRCRCISFQTEEPYKNANPPKRHGFNINLSLVTPVRLRGTGVEEFVLPVTFDPDIENKGEDRKRTRKKANDAR